MTQSKSRNAARSNSYAAAPTPRSAEPRVAALPAGEAPRSVLLGRQLRAAREAQGRDIGDCALALHLPARVLKKLEAGDYTGISEGVYLRNYLSSYGANVGLREDILRAAIAQLVPTEEQPALVSTGGISRSHYLWRRFTTFGTYMVLTAVIVVPLVWLGLKGGLDRELTRLEPLNPAAVAQSATRAETADATQAGPTRAEKPLMASLAPFSALDSVDTDAAAVTPPPPVVASPGHTLSITLSMPSWVEVSTVAGDHLEYNLLPAGAHKVYDSSQPLQVNIGDTAAASVQVDGKTVDLAPYEHANVAHFRVVPQAGQTVVQPM